jgi:DNA replicative helicase MCM subunit Mcm2 (Cdc46/Mcm family)
MRDILQDEAAEEERAISALRRLNGDFEDPSNTEHLLDTRFLQCFFSVARETTEIIIPKKIMTLIAKEQVRSRLNRSDGDSVSNRRINSIGRLACAAAKISFCDTVTKEHAEFAFSIMAKTLMDISPSASEGGLTSQQVNRDSAIWHALNTYYSITDKTQFSLEDLINGVIDCWVTVNEGTAPKRDTILQAITGFLSTGKRHTTNGGLKKVGNTWGFDND